MARRVTENTDRHITVRQLESTVRLAQGRKTQFYKRCIYFTIVFSACEITFFETC
jgi:hypothetical protein